MAERTYIPELVKNYNKAHKYAQRYREKYYPDLTGEQKIALDGALAAVQLLLVTIVPPPPEPNA